jgi:hypothetical protein
MKLECWCSVCSKAFENWYLFAQKVTDMPPIKECPLDNNQRTKKVQNHVQILKFKLDNNKIRNVIVFF